MAHKALPIPYFLSLLIAALMAAQSLLGLALAEQYRDVEWIRATWFGNDWVTLVLGVPLLCAGLLLARGGSRRGLLLWFGMLGYCIYNYAFYMLGAVLNAFFPVYVILFVASGIALILALSGISARGIADRFRPETPVRWLGGYYLFVAGGLTLVWVITWWGHVFAGQALPVEEAAFRLIAALDLTLMVPALAAGGILLWRRNAWGYVIAAVAGTQASLYLIVLSVNSAVAIALGLTEAPGELPMWGVLAVATGAATSILFKSVNTEYQYSPKRV